MMKNIKLDSINYLKFMDFLESGKDEFNYFTNRRFYGTVIPVSEYLTEYEGKVKLFKEAISEDLEKIQDRNFWVGDVISIPEGDILYFKSDDLYSNGVYLKRNLESGEFVNGKSYIGTSLDVIGSVFDLKQSERQIRELTDRNKKELVNISEKARRIFSINYGSKETISGTMAVVSNSDKSRIVVENRECLKPILTRNYNDSMIDRGYQYESKLNNFEGNKKCCDTLDNNQIKLLQKKIYVRK